MAYDVCMVSSYGKHPMVKDILAINKAISKIKKTDVRMIFPKLENPEHWEILAYTDARHASLPNGSSQGAYIIFVKWLITRSIYYICQMAYHKEHILYLSKETIELPQLHGNPKSYNKVKIITDSKSLCDHLFTNNTVDDFRLRVDMARLKEMVDVGEINIEWIEGKRQLADPLTKLRATSALLVKTINLGFHQ